MGVKKTAQNHNQKNHATRNAGSILPEFQKNHLLPSGSKYNQNIKTK